MARGIADYLSMLKKVKVGRQTKVSAPYQWKSVTPGEKAESKVLFGICSSCMQHDCATRVYLEDDIVVRIEGNPESPPNYGCLCARGNSEIMGLYNPYRVKTPLVRTNPEKGLDVDPMWKEVTWDEALDLVARRLKEIREKDPRGLVLCEGMGNEESFPFRRAFCRAFGTPNLIASRGPLCTIHYASCLVHAAMPEAVVDMDHSHYVVSLGRSMGPNFATTGAMRRFAGAMARGMNLVVIDPRCSYEASKGEWIPIRPGSDLAFLLAMAHVMMQEGLQYDVWFMKNRTNAPYLIGADGYYLRDPESGKPMMWDPVQGCARTFDAEFKDIALTGAYPINGVQGRTAFDLVKEEFAAYTPEWAEPICTVPAQTIRRIARDFVSHSRIGSTIEIDGFTFPYRPASVNTHRGVNNHRGGTYADLTGKIINMLVGNIEVPGGCLGDGRRGPLLEPDEDGVVKPYGEAAGTPFKFPPDRIDCAEFYPNKHTGPHLTTKAILNPERYHHDYRVEGWLTVGGNPVRKNAQPQTHVEALKKIPFVVSCAYHMDETAILSDVVLPEHCSLERHLVKTLRPSHQTVGKEIFVHMAYMRQPVSPTFNTMHEDDIYTELAERMGILYGQGGLYDHLNTMDDVIIRSDGLSINAENRLDTNRKHSLEEVSDRQLKSWKRGDGRGLDHLKKTGFFAHRMLEKEYYLYYYFPGNTTRHPFYFQHLKQVGDTLRANLERENRSFPGIDDMDYVFDLYRPIPHWVENSEFRAPAEYDLWVVNWRTPYFSSDSSNVSGNPWLAEVSKKDPFDQGVFMNSGTAQSKGLRDGDTVVVESRYGKTEGELRLTELLHPLAVGIPGCHGLGTIYSNPVIKQGAHWNALLSLDDATFDAVSAGMESSPRVKVYKSEGRP
jgi:anaerobic selenocysteine-containing dehydrogenase